MTEFQNKPKNILEGAKEGVVGSVTELASGVSGLLLKPVEGAKKKGALGFFSGLGQGLLGAITSPVTGVLQLATNISTGIKGSVESIGNNNQIKTWVRFPLYIGPLKSIDYYDEAIAICYNKLCNIKEGNFSEEFILFHHLEKEKKNHVYHIITNKRWVSINNKNKIKISVRHNQIKNFEVE